ncbi:hypothetical protein [Diaphorobacter sp.]|uniref:hypothetical protein n=1 Tax=Diaphorobacter sp. TaxID=1934310 RepID=UPI0028A81768|nr:hypothetical protein [Diaphorobacter sp.]
MALDDQPNAARPAQAQAAVGGAHWLHSLGAAALWTLAQHASFFLCAWVVSWWAGAERFGAFGQALALVAMVPAAITLRLEYAGQIERRPRRAAHLFSLAQTNAWACTVALLLALALVSLFTSVPAWLWAGACAVLPQAGMLILAAHSARRCQVVKAAALRAAPALAMVLALMVAWALQLDRCIEWTIPLAAWACWLIVIVRGRVGFAPERKPQRPWRVLSFHARFVRAELPGFLLNTSANHGQVLLIGAMGGDVAAGVAALALRIAMLPTSVFGLALADRLRARVVAAGRSGEGVLDTVRQAILRMTGLSLAAHVMAWIVVTWVLPWVFPAQGDVLVRMVLVLLPLGFVRFVASPLAFLLPWRGWLTLSLLGQCLLFACAVLSVVLGFPRGGLTAVAAAYTISAIFVYLGYLLVSLKAVRVDT